MKQKKERDDSSSSSNESDLLDNLTDCSRYSTSEAFQAVIREKITDIKVSDTLPFISPIALCRHSWMKRSRARTRMRE